MNPRQLIDTNNSQRILFELLLRLPITLGLMVVGITIIFGPKWSPEIIYIILSPNHGFTAQDAVALVPISLGVIWFGMGLWKHRLSLRNHIHNSPEKAFIVALMIGLLTGLFLGTGLGTVFKSVIVSFAKRVF